MGFPPGMVLNTIAFGIPFTITGKDVVTKVSVKPTSRVIWAATGQPLPEFTDSFTADAGQLGQFQVPSVDQAGFIDSAGNAVTDWAYQVTGSWEFANERPIPWSKNLKPLLAQSNPIDLDLVPDGPVSIPVTAPSAAVLGFGGRTGFITLQESDLPERLGVDQLVSGKGGNVARFIKRAQAKEVLKIVALGDSVLELVNGTVALLVTDLSARFGTTVTATNYAVSGYTTAASFINGKIRDGINAAGDLYLIAFGKNDGGWEREGSGDWPVPGYDQTASIATLEQMVRLIRADVPKADIMLLAENPYTPLVSAANTVLQAYNEAVRRVAAAYGCEFVDGYQPFADAANLATLVPDGTHPGLPEGHRLLTDTILAHIPAVYPGPSLAPSAGNTASRTMAGTQKTDTTTTLRGWTTSATTGGTGSGVWTNSGAGWAGSAPYVTSTAGDYAEFTMNTTELLTTISTLAADAPVVDISVDGAPLYTARSLTQGKQGSAYLVPIVTGLTPGLHTIRITLVSGTLKIHQASWTEAGTGFVPDVVMVDLGSFAGETAIDNTGAIVYLINNPSAIPLPAGWSKMDVRVEGYVKVVVKGETTTTRLVQANVRLDLALMQDPSETIPVQATGAEHAHTFNLVGHGIGKTAAVGVRLETRMQGAVLTNGFYRGWKLVATCYRRA